MFHDVLRLSLCSPEPLLEAVVKALQADADFRHKVTFSAQAQSLSAPELAREDIFFTDSDHLASLPDLRKTAKPAARIVLIDTAGQEAALQESLVSLLDDIWPLSANPDIVARRINGLLRDALLCKEYALLQHCLETTIDTTPDLVWFKDIQGKHLNVNQAFCHFVGKSKEDIIGRGHYYIWDIRPDEYAKSEYVCLETEEEVIARGATCTFDESVKTKLGMPDLRFHDLRHEAVSRLVEGGLSDQEVSAISGHKSMQMLKRYTHLRAEDLVSKLDQLENKRP